MLDLWWWQPGEAAPEWMAARRHWLTDTIADDEKRLSQLWRRELLAQYLAVEPAALEFAVGDKGKPGLCRSSLHFSVSHGGGWHLLLVADHPCGVDVEDWSRELSRVNRPAVWKRFAEAEALQAGDARTFLRCWTLKEAWAKCLGKSVWEVLAEPLAGNAGDWQVADMASGHADLPACAAWVVDTRGTVVPGVKAYRA